MLSTAVSMLLTLAWMWHGRDGKLWSPTFKGTHQERFITAMHHYQGKMGLEGEEYVFLITPHEYFCAWVSKQNDGTTIVGYNPDPFAKDCTSVKPEILALHESCHVRMQHHLLEVRRSFPNTEVMHNEVKACMKAYSEKVRR